MTRLIDADELLAALEGVAIPATVRDLIRSAPATPHMMTYADVLEIYRDKLERTDSMDEALMKVAWVSFNRGLDAAKP